MTEHKKLPSVTTRHTVAVVAEKRGSLVARGLMAVQRNTELSLSDDARYCEARAKYAEWREWLGIKPWNLWVWSEREDPELLVVFRTFQQLAGNCYGKAYYPLSDMYQKKKDGENNKNLAHDFAQKAFDWCFANRSKQDVELWCDLGDMYKDGHGIANDDRQAKYWYRKAAKQGCAYAQYSLGDMLNAYR